MRRLSRDALRMRLQVALTVRKARDRRGLDIMTETAVNALVEDLLTRIMGSPASEAVILEPDMAGPPHAPWRGKWGVDEPHPFPDVSAAQHGPGQP